MSELKKLMIKSRLDFDLTNPAHHQELTVLAERMLGTRSASVADLRAACGHPDAPLEYRIATKLAESRHFMRGIKREIKVGVVYAMWGERARLQPRSDVNPMGEDSLRVKLDQLAWASHATPVDWALYPVDDGCPDNSGTLASTIAATHAHASRTRVHHLEDAVSATTGPLKNLNSADDSRKAGAIILGCMKAIEDGMDCVVYTDADNSVHLGQLGLLLKPHIENNSGIVLGNRKHTDSVLVKSADRWGPGIKVLRHMQRMVGQEIFSRGIRDTQAAFKLFDSNLLQQIIASPTVYDFSFDTDWIAAAISMDKSFDQVPFAFVDSEAESASAKQNPMTTWETLLLGLNKSVSRYDLLTSRESREMSRVIAEEIHDYRDLELLIDHVPHQLANASETDFGSAGVMQPAQLQDWIQGRKRAFAAETG